MAHASGAASCPVLSEMFRPETVRGADGFFRVAEDRTGRWWLIDAENRPFFCKAVHGVGPAETFGTPAPVARLRRWGFNATGAGSAVAGEGGLAYIASAGFCQAGPLIHSGGARLPDVFAPDWPRLATAWAAERCTPFADDPRLLGWAADDAPGWAQPLSSFSPSGLSASTFPSASPPASSPSLAPAPDEGHPLSPLPSPSPTLLQLCLSLEPAFAAYHAAWEFVLALHGGRLESLARAWGVPVPNRVSVRELTRTERGLATRGYHRDDVRWSREFARRYFTTTAAALRAADPNHLVLGCRFAGPVGAAILAECVYPAVDVALVDWNELPSGTTGGPVLADNVGWAEEKFFAASVTTRPGRLTAVERMLRRGRAALDRTARHAAVTGYVWRQWLDDPAGQPPFARGLVHLNGAEAREHTEPLAAFNLRAESLRRAAAAPAVSL